MRYFETRKARIEIIPMIDIMLFLLVFFAMLTLRMIPSSGQLSKLPTSSTTSTLPAPKLLIEIQANGQLMAEGSSRTLDEIRALIQRQDASKLAVTIAGGEDTSMQRVMDVIDVVKTSGVTQVGLAARHPTR
ncbi:biopolymer transporter ExbD [Limnohabitans sp. JirII-31]|uniref:ExbD/TolR family protein n=1 Tax=Limnohabitans sp. JirII-31 TaxID=1977908 RepID=UPI000C1E5889|nr:biopolymer transporter ExbD [Limnohabitans sp. JirII-31]PIT74260.1 biopolymer transporter ExbD [Limnohabitans sp. JirII-31]